MRLKVFSNLIFFTALALGTGAYSIPVNGADLETYHFHLGQSKDEGSLQLITASASSVEDVLAAVAPGWRNLDLVETKTHITGFATRHERWQLAYHGIVIDRSYVILHWRDSILVAFDLQGPNLSHIEPPTEYPWQESAPPLLDSKELLTATPRWVAQAQTLAPAWHYNFNDLKGIRTERIVLLDGTVEREESLVFDMGEGVLYEGNPLESEPTHHVLNNLKGNGYLENDVFAVYGADRKAVRAYSADHRYEYSPTEHPQLFDQVQAFYNAERSMSWFKEALGFQFAGEPITIFTNAPLANNAQYIPPSTSLPAQVLLGVGDGSVLQNLTRDGDVTTHELAHHIIYDFVPTSRSDSGILHEGTADYFTYALNDDPYLAESVVPDRPYLRTADLPQDKKFDAPKQSRAAHQLGQYWSAVLWDLRKEAGERTDELVYQALHYLPPEAKMSDAFLAVLQADRDLNPLPTNDPDYNSFGLYKCTILKSAVNRGFTTYLAGIDGASCGLDLANLAGQRADELDTGKKGKLKIFGVPCGVVAGGHGGGLPLWLCLLPIFMPLVLKLLHRPADASSKANANLGGV